MNELTQYKEVYSYVRNHIHLETFNIPSIMMVSTALNLDYDTVAECFDYMEIWGYIIKESEYVYIISPFLSIPDKLKNKIRYGY